MKITILGSGSSRAIPRIGCRCAACHDARQGGKSGRTRSSIFIQKNDTAVLIDTSPDFLVQMRRNKVKKIDAVFFTHEHIDATGGFGDFLTWCHNKKLAPIVYVSESVKIFLQRHFASQLHREPMVIFRTMPSYRAVVVGEITLEPFDVRHGVTSDVPTVGYRVNSRLIFISDFDEISHKSQAYLKIPRAIFIFDAAMWFGRAILGHLDPRRAILCAQPFNPRVLYLTQIGHTYPVHELAQKKIKSYARAQGVAFHVHLAYDGLSISVARRSKNS